MWLLLTLVRKFTILWYTTLELCSVRVEKVETGTAFIIFTKFSWIFTFVCKIYVSKSNVPCIYMENYSVARHVSILKQLFILNILRIRNNNCGKDNFDARKNSGLKFSILIDSPEIYQFSHFSAQIEHFTCISTQSKKFRKC